MAPARSHLKPILLALFVTFLWSTSWILIKIGLREIPAVSFAGLRYSLAFVVLVPFILSRSELRTELRALESSDWRRLSLLGVIFYALTQGAQFLGLALLPAVTLSLILSFSPAAVALLGIPLLGERLAPRQWVGVALFVAGASIYFFPSAAPRAAMGLAVAVVGLLANSGGAILGRSVNRRRNLHPLIVTLVSMGVGSFVLLATGLAVEGIPSLDLSGWAIVLWLAVVNTALAFTLWNYALRDLSAVEASLINNTMMIQIAVLAWLFLGESVGAREAAGLLVAVLGVVLVQVSAVRSPETARST